MKLTVRNNYLHLTVETTIDSKIKNYTLPMEYAHNIHYWYPFNSNFYYKYSNFKNILYLTKDKGYSGDNVYDIKDLKKTKALKKLEGVWFNSTVYYRNLEKMIIAKTLGIPVVNQPFTMKDVVRGFKTWSLEVERLKNTLIDRSFESDDFLTPEMLSYGWDDKFFELATKDELRYLKEDLGEIYIMLSVMRKIAEGRRT
ncbi:anti-sigma factor [Bacillus phage Shbh1]|uniref:Uncharacterized protein n=1 Tax=Bacillus phage Shbh1 TaxID=1796992 RepID=A0A142F1H0_9CAUD|nr:anti-sigma factor [Bacillus phage Shbh1]AMQ66627.1 hypothetical protein [Bacillus phage Shbh1]